ncbi:unnamed protein product [Darwinula stevensoni]|uniref:Uncharacterized protein n=1 Tax=Darwinula stevensoni TaxID=69355 RepID=A0A7R9AE09_9CRUS|nr:unnamed protein product [Darwinula stevensoni]CAG0901878.1 unnamed protein product [Darwinula stevensoni]
MKMNADGDGPGENEASFWIGYEDLFKEIQDMKSYYERMAELCNEAIQEPHACMKKKMKEVTIPSQPKRTLEEVLRDKKERKEVVKRQCRNSQLF